MCTFLSKIAAIKIPVFEPEISQLTFPQINVLLQELDKKDFELRALKDMVSHPY